MKDAIYKYIQLKKKLQQTIEADFSAVCCSNAPLVAGRALTQSSWPLGLLQNEPVAFSIPTCCVPPLINPQGHGPCSRRVRFAASCIILPKTHLSENRLAVESCADSLQLLWRSYFCLKRRKKKRTKKKEKASQQLGNAAILYAGVPF